MYGMRGRIRSLTVICSGVLAAVLVCTSIKKAGLMRGVPQFFLVHRMCLHAEKCNHAAFLRALGFVCQRITLVLQSEAGCLHGMVYLPDPPYVHQDPSLKWSSSLSPAAVFRFLCCGPSHILFKLLIGLQEAVLLGHA